MILPFRLFRSTDTKAIEAHEKLVLEVATESSKDILPMFGEGRRMTDSAVFDRAALGYARPLALVMRHVDFAMNGKRAPRIKEALLKGASELATKNPAFLPPSLDLACAASVCIAYPGGVDLHNMLPDVYIQPSLAGDGARFRRVVDLMDMYWIHTAAAIEKWELLGKLENRDPISEPDQKLIDELREELLPPTKPPVPGDRSPPEGHYRRLAVKLNQEWRREEGDNSPKWAALCRYWTAAREAVKFPEIDEEQP